MTNSSKFSNYVGARCTRENTQPVHEEGYVQGRDAQWHACFDAAWYVVQAQHTVLVHLYSSVTRTQETRCLLIWTSYIVTIITVANKRKLMCSVLQIIHLGSVVIREPACRGWFHVWYRWTNCNWLVYVTAQSKERNEWSVCGCTFSDKPLDSL